MRIDRGGICRRRRRPIRTLLVHHSVGITSAVQFGLTKGSVQAALREPDTALLVFGFGFNDDHLALTHPVAVETNMSLRLSIGDPGFLTSKSLIAGDHSIAQGKPMTNRFLRAFARLAESGDARIHLINGRSTIWLRRCPT